MDKYTIDHCASLDKFSKGLSFLGWAYNEEENITDYLEKAVNLLEGTVADYEIIVVNDGSTDRTREVVLSFSDKNPRIKLIDNPGNKGVAYACLNAIRNASKEYLMWQTVDWSYDISKLRGFLDYIEINNVDVAVGVRREPVLVVNKMHKILSGIMRLFKIQHLTKRSDTLWKAFVSVCNYMLIRTLFNVPLSDYQNVCIFRSSEIKKIAQNSEAKSSFLCPELLFKSYWEGLLLCELPISFIPRQKGEAKGTGASAIKSSITDILSLYWKWRKINPALNTIKPILRLESDRW